MSFLSFFPFFFLFFFIIKGRLSHKFRFVVVYFHLIDYIHFMIIYLHLNLKLWWFCVIFRVAIVPPWYMYNWRVIEWDLLSFYFRFGSFTTTIHMLQEFYCNINHKDQIKERRGKNWSCWKVIMKASTWFLFSMPSKFLSCLNYHKNTY